ncbi:NAD(P)-binding domain-containing protein, partial [Pseudoalteromonas sp. SIMBA_148]
SLVADGATHVDSLVELVQQLEAPRAVWVMLPAGEITEQTIATLAELMEAGDTIIDGGNTFYKDDIRRATALKLKCLNYVDVG